MRQTPPTRSEDWSGREAFPPYRGTPEYERSSGFNPDAN